MTSKNLTDKFQLTITINFISYKDDKERVMHAKSGNI